MRRMLRLVSLARRRLSRGRSTANGVLIRRMVRLSDDNCFAIY